VIAAEINEDEYRIASSTAEFWPEGEWGPLDCGCCLVAETFDPVGPKLLLMMQRRDAAPHTHQLGEFKALL
jgi:hypothetical protein